MKQYLDLVKEILEIGEKKEIDQTPEWNEFIKTFFGSFL